MRKEDTMIYLDKTTAAQPLYIPRSVRGVEGALSLTLRSTVGLSVVLDVDPIDLDTSSLYYRLAVSLPEGIAVGEYEYTLADLTGDLATGLAWVGTLNKPTEYDTSIEYEQYTTTD